mgnify:CR=1 FL=1
MSYFSTDEEIEDMIESIRERASSMFDEDDTKQIIMNIGDDIEAVHELASDMDDTEFQILMESILM